MLAGAALAITCGSALAQSTSISDQFLDAVQQRDGDKTTQILAEHPNVVNDKDADGDSALMIAIKRKDSDWTGWLLNKQADPNLADRAGDTPMIAAARLGFDQAVEWLLEIGAKVDATNRMGETPLIVAVQQRDAPMVRLLLKAGADPDIQDSAAGYSARDYAKRDARSRDILRLIESAKPRAPANAAN